MSLKKYEDELRDLMIRMEKDGIILRAGADKEIDDPIECLCLEENVMYIW